MIWESLTTLQDLAMIPTIFSKIGIIPSWEDNPELAAAFSSGNFEWNHILLFGLYLIKFLLLGAGIQAIIGIMQGGYRYILGSVVEDKEKGRDTLKNTLIGFVLVILAWALVDLVVALLTSG